MSKHMSRILTTLYMTRCEQPCDQMICDLFSRDSNKKQKLCLTHYSCSGLLIFHKMFSGIWAFYFMSGAVYTHHDKMSPAVECRYILMIGTDNDQNHKHNNGRPEERMYLGKGGSVFLVHFWQVNGSVKSGMALGAPSRCHGPEQ